MNEGGKSEKRFPLLLVATAAVFIVFLLSFIVGQNGIVQLRQLEAEYDRVQTGNYKLAMENRETAQEIQRLRQDPAKIEKLAREELNFVSPHDVVLLVADAEEGPLNSGTKNPPAHPPDLP